MIFPFFCKTTSIVRKRLLLLVVFLLYSLWSISTYSVPYESSAATPLVTHPKNRSVAFATVLGSDDYWVGVTVLRRSLQEHHPEVGHSVDFVVLCTTAVSESVQAYLRVTGAVVHVVQEIHNPYDPHTRFLGSFAKLYLWNLTNYDQVVYMDADCYVNAPVTQLFACDRFCVRPNRAASASVCPFNSGVMVLRPCANKFRALLRVLESQLLPSDDRADQGFLNSFHYYDCMGIAPDPDTYDGDFTQQLQLARALAKEHGLGLPWGCAALPMLRHGDRARCQLLPYEYNFDVRSRMVWWSYWVLGFFTASPVVAQFTGPFKPWDCASIHLTMEQTLTCAQPLYRKYQAYF